MLLARNTRAEFADVSETSETPFHEAWVARGLAVGDPDNDGRLDAVVVTNDGPVHILHNETPTKNHWLILELACHKSNRDAIGAEVRVTTPDLLQTVTVALPAK